MLELFKVLNEINWSHGTGDITGIQCFPDAFMPAKSFTGKVLRKMTSSRDTRKFTVSYEPDKTVITFLGRRRTIRK